MVLLFSSVLLLGSIANARVRFQTSEVLQESDLVSTNRASFHCINGCKLYTDSRSPNLYVVEYNNDTNVYEPIVAFSNIGGPSVQLPKPYRLPLSKDYFIENRGEKNPSFVFYALDDAVDDSYSTVRVLTSDSNFVIGSSQAKVTRVTVLSSKSAALTYSHYGGAYTNGFPRIFATGSDAVHNCRPVYQARNLENVYDSAITVFAPISTFDFGTLVDHSVNVTFNKYGTIAHAPKSSVVYSSPGYVGCPYLYGETYTSPAYGQTVSDSFSLQATSLIINADAELPAFQDAVRLNVNDETFNIYKNAIFNKVFNATSYDVDIKWRKNTPEATFSMQLDFDWNP